ncbi:MAG: type IV secretory system conjugative DNA transfer family protein [Clostridia bacterium]|nr:type IV secretory system conjugative DNA transfer family protein [Clostridia bacterium]
MGEKLKRAIKKARIHFIVVIILWLVLAIVFVAPMSIALADAKVNGVLHFKTFFEKLFENMQNLGTSIFSAFGANYIGNYFGVLFKFTIVYIIAAIIGIAKMWPKSEYDTIEHGSSDWSEHGEQYKVLDPKKGILLAEKNYLPVDKRGNTNVLVIGGSGAGKSASFVIPNAYQQLGSYVFTDPKGELYDKTAGYLRANGYEIKIFNLINPKNSDGYNPLFHIKSELDVDVIANTIVKGQVGAENKSDPYWDDMSEALLKALIYYLKATRPEEEQNLASCAELVRAANNNGGDNLLTNLMSQLPYDHPARRYYKNIEIAPDKTYSSILSSLQSKLGKFDSKDIAELTSTNTIEFEDIGRKKTAVYVISSDTHAAYDFLLTIFFSQMIQQLYDFADLNGGALSIPTYFILDEFANIGKIPDFDKKISTSRSRKISFSVILQNLDQLEAVYKEAHETIMGNCDTHLFLGSNSQKTVEYFSKALGEKTITRDNVSRNTDRESRTTGHGYSDQIMARALLTPDELRRLDNDLCIIYEKGIKPIKANKYYYFKYPTAKYAAMYPASHNDIEPIDRGVWRTYNPYNPYEEENEIKENTKIESLDDLFEEPSDDKAENLEELKVEEPKQEKVVQKVATNVEPKIEENDELDDLMSPTLPDAEEGENLAVDIQKELEDKFDELFGAFDDEE